MNHIDQPLRLSVGSHKAGSGKGCAMNVVSWENGDTTITDMPACADPMLARIVQRINDSYCTHTTDGLLCPECSIMVLELAHRTVGTGLIDLTDGERRQVWVKVAVDQARSVLHLASAKDRPKAIAAIEAAQAWADDPSEINRLRAATYAASAAAAASAASADYAYAAASASYAASAAYAYPDTYAAYAASAAAYAYPDTYPDTYAAYAAYNAYAAAAAATAYAAASTYTAHRAIDVFCKLTGFTPTPTPVETTIDAYRKMVTV